LSASITMMREAQQKNARIYLVSKRDRGSTAKADSHRRGTGRPLASDCCRYLVARRRGDCAFLLPARTERRDYSGREPANLGLWETPIRGAHVVPGWRATEESTLAMKPGRSSFQGLLTGLMMVGGCGPGAVLWVGSNTAPLIERQPRNVPSLGSRHSCLSKGHRGSASEGYVGSELRRGVRKGRPGVRCARRGDHERHARAQLHVLGG